MGTPQDGLEPDAREIDYQTAPLWSAAISLRRIADALERRNEWEIGTRTPEAPAEESKPPIRARP